MPCADQSATNLSHKSEMAQHSTDDKHHDNHHCSPFCTCECCVTPVVANDYVIQFNSFPFFSKLVVVYSIAYMPNQYFSVWQPPKLS